MAETPAEPERLRLDLQADLDHLDRRGADDAESVARVEFRNGTSEPP
jgi:hypothetical protein